MKKQKEKKDAHRLDFFFNPICSCFHCFPVFTLSYPMNCRYLAKPTSPVSYLARPATGETSSFARDGRGWWILGYFLRHTLKTIRSCEVSVNDLSARTGMTSPLAKMFLLLTERVEKKYFSFQSVVKGELMCA